MVPPMALKTLRPLAPISCACEPVTSRVRIMPSNCQSNYRFLSTIYGCRDTMARAFIGITSASQASQYRPEVCKNDEREPTVPSRNARLPQLGHARQRDDLR